MQLIDGKLIAEKIKDTIVAETSRLGDERPNLAIILVGNRADSTLYVELKEKQAKTVGIDTHTYRINEIEGMEALENVITYLNNDPAIDAILLQLPLPENFDEDRAVALIDPAKDVDGFHPENLKNYLAGKETLAEPVVPAVVREMLGSIDFAFKQKKASVIANSELFGSVLAHELGSLGMVVEVTSVDDENLKSKTAMADVIVTAVGKPALIKKEMIKTDAIIIDIGIAKNKDGKVVGDADFESIKDKASFITPVPGGVGPVTIAVALRSVLRLFKARQK